MIDGVNALIVQLHQTLSLRGAGNAADVDTDDNVSPDGGDTSSGEILVVAVLAVPMMVELLWNNLFVAKPRNRGFACSNP